MLAVIGVMAAGAAIVLIELPSWRKWSKKEKWTFSVTLTVALTLAVAKSARAPLPNPLDWIAYLYKPFSDLVFGWLA
ncbi:MAG: hypothetical protein K0R28_1507 [Paenibacillus sp.]|jgi:integral membrane sensor domain MASE1|nr:hypothetical protein [Paenibacillus sp.]